MIEGWKCFATVNAIKNVLPIDALSLTLFAILLGLRSKIIALHSYAKARTANVFPDPVGPKNRKYTYRSNFSFNTGDPNCIATYSAKATLN